ncbi:hypothetical protein EDD18DRAFT_1099830 [Armillaria luteobubalina]|uniref:Protein kinase domain-containing protein n=1 Tax=Armillaria luteobubalina TaxID=153913 RepID=A0AA39TX29_9AGAR|nr:hypothetical protein EDD18DRAFT_1099830 [Armillaria luteobubalina]
MKCLQDIWEERLHNTQICLKVLRIFISGEAREKVVRVRISAGKLSYGGSSVISMSFPFLGFSEELFACLISPWMDNGNILSYLQAHPDHDRITTLVQVSDAMQYLHNLQQYMPTFVGCVHYFGLSLIAESQNFNTTSGMKRPSAIPEYILPESFDHSYIVAGDAYAYGCTVIENVSEFQQVSDQMPEEFESR